MTIFWGINEWTLFRIELRSLPIESYKMNGFELRGIETPLIRGDLQPVEDVLQGMLDVNLGQ